MALGRSSATLPEADAQDLGSIPILSFTAEGCASSGRFYSVLVWSRLDKAGLP
jgi:hypothetical protein